MRTQCNSFCVESAFSAIPAASQHSAENNQRLSFHHLKRTISSKTEINISFYIGGQTNGNAMPGSCILRKLYGHSNCTSI